MVGGGRGALLHPSTLYCGVPGARIGANEYSCSTLYSDRTVLVLTSSLLESAIKVYSPRYPILDR